MNSIVFEWDENKNRINEKKHGISFEDVENVFSDRCAILFDDPEHSLDEERFLILGLAITKGVCVVSHCYRENDHVIRIISARKATKSEKYVYRENQEVVF